MDWDAEAVLYFISQVNPLIKAQKMLPISLPSKMQ